MNIAMSTVHSSGPFASADCPDEERVVGAVDAGA
jgi:hypothetical protein